MKNGLSVKTDTTKELMKALKTFNGSEVLVGIPSTTAGREPDPQNPSPINNATIGYIMENGSPAANIPPRPHLRPGVEDNKAKIVNRYRGAAKKALDGDLKAIGIAHQVVGQETADAVKAKITEGPFEALAASTLAARRRRGFAGESPLIETGAYRNAITYVVRPRGK